MWPFTERKRPVPYTLYLHMPEQWERCSGCRCARMISRPAGWSWDRSDCPVHGPSGKGLYEEIGAFL